MFSPLGGEPVDVLVENGCISQIQAEIVSHVETITVIDGENRLLLPGLIDAHAHVNKTLWGLPWHKNQVPGTRLLDFVENERRIRRELQLSPEKQASTQFRLALSKGTTHIRTHVDVDTEIGLANIEGVLAAGERFRDMMDLQIVAFPQSGMLVRPGTVELLEEAVKAGADLIGGLDPSTMDRDPVRHLDTIFGIAERQDVDLDIHLHEPGMLGAFSVELIAERTRALGMQGRVTISHVFCLGMIEDAYLQRLLDLLLENQIAIMTLGSGARAFPPIKQLYEAGVTLCSGTDGIRDTWSPYGNADMVEKAMLLGYRSGFRKDEDLEMLLNITTYGGARVMGAKSYGLEVGCRADFVVVDGETLVEAIVTRTPRRYVVKNGRIVAIDGKCTV